MGGRARVALLVVLTLVAAACGARFEDEEGRVAAGAGGLTAEECGQTTDTLAPGETIPGDPGTASTLPGGATPTSTAAGGGGGGGSGAPRAVEPGPAPGVSATEIKIGYLLPITGAAPVPQAFEKGVNAYYDDINAKGGVNGRRIRVVIKDTQSQATVGKTRAQELIEQDKVFAVVVLDRLENQKAIGEYLDSRKMPNLSIQTPADLGRDQEWTFGITIDHGVQGALIAEYFAKVLKASKVAVVHENTPILDPGVAAFKAKADELGIEVAYSKSIDGNANDYSSEAFGLQQSGATATWLYMAPTPAAKLANQADAIGYHPTWFANSISWAFNLVFAVGAKALAGARAFSPWVALDDPRTANYQRAYRANNNNETPDDLGLIGWGVGQIMAEGLRRAGPGLGQNSFRGAMQNMKFRPDVWAPLTFGPGVRQGANVIAVLKEQNSRWVQERDFTGSF